MIHTENLTKKFGNVLAVENLNLDIKEGEVFGFLGPNGAGKTTTVRMLASLIGPTSGTATVAGFMVGKQDIGMRNLHNPDMIRSLVEANANIQFIGELHYSLEEVYLQLVKNA